MDAEAPTVFLHRFGQIRPSNPIEVFFWKKKSLSKNKGMFYFFAQGKCFPGNDPLKIQRATIT